MDYLLTYKSRFLSAPPSGSVLDGQWITFMLTIAKKCPHPQMGILKWPLTPLKSIMYLVALSSSRVLCCNMNKGRVHYNCITKTIVIIQSKNSKLSDCRNQLRASKYLKYILQIFHYSNSSFYPFSNTIITDPPQFL
jgi:hypothetical protein